MQATLAQNIERDKMICDKYIEGIEPREIVALLNFDIGEIRVRQILYENVEYLNNKIAWPKFKRLREYEKLFPNAPDYKESRDKIDILVEMRKEIEGDKPLVDQSTNITQIVYNRKLPDGYDNTPTSGGKSLINDKRDNS